jgi:hypothetical protein
VKLKNHSPPISPSPAQQRDALRKGLGRALQWALSGRLDHGLLLEACLQDQRFDLQVESSRAEWLWQMIRAAGAMEPFRVPILHALHDLSDEHSGSHLCEMARLYAQAGDEAFRTRLYEIVEQKPFAHIPWLGEEEIMGLDGEQGFLFAARARGQLLAGRKWECDDDSLMNRAIERFGMERARGVLDEFPDEAINRFRENWQRGHNVPKGGGIQAHQDRMAAIPIEEALRAAEGADRRFWLRGWGRCAKETDLQIVLQRLCTEREPRVIVNLLNVFAARGLPNIDPRLIELCRHDDENVRQRAFGALQQNSHPLVREVAMTELHKGIREGGVVALFIKNYRQGDEHRILEAMELPEDECELHWLLMDVIKVLEKNREADCSRLGVICYALTPCETCRFDAARLLFNQQVAPEWLAEECQYDSGEDCRQLVHKAAGSTEAE